MINFVYCFDENYNFQAFSSMVSLLDKVSEKINIFVIHRIEDRLDFIPGAIKKHINIIVKPVITPLKTPPVI